MIRSARELYNLQRNNRSEWFRIINRGESAPVAVHLYDNIGMTGISAQDFISAIADVDGPIELHINSEGGEVFEGMAIYNALNTRKGVYVIVDALAASIAGVIAMAADAGELAMAPNSEFMMHDAFGIVGGNAREVASMANRLDKESERIARIFAERTGKTAEHWRGLMREETWFDENQAVEAGLADKVLPRVKNVTGNMENAAHHPYHAPHEVLHEPVTGMHSHNHASNGHPSGDDGIHAHSHYHNNDAVHGHDHTTHEHDHQHEHPHVHAHELGGLESFGAHTHEHPHHAGFETHTGPVMPGEVVHTPGTLGAGIGPSAHLYEGSDMDLAILALLPEGVFNWDAGAAMGKCHSASDFRSICAGERSTGEPDTQAHWALPHHNSPGAGPDKGGVIAALGRWNQTQGLKNKQAALSHLRSHARSLGLPSGNDALTTEVYNDEDVKRLIEALKGA